MNKFLHQVLLDSGTHCANFVQFVIKFSVYGHLKGFFTWAVATTAAHHASRYQGALFGRHHCLSLHEQ